MATSKQSAILSGVVHFLRSVGLEVRIVPGADSFVPGVQIARGVLEVDPGCLPSNLLHEAGHLAITPARYRASMHGNLFQSMRDMAEDAMMQCDDEDMGSPLYRAVIQCSDTEATAWAWAAGMHIGLPGDAIVLDDQYDGDGSSIRTMLTLCQYAGIHGLAHADMCRIRANSCKDGELPYPHLLKWTQDAGEAPVETDHGGNFRSPFQGM